MALTESTLDQLGTYITASNGALTQGEADVRA